MNQFDRALVTSSMTSRALRSFAVSLGVLGLAALAQPVHAGSTTDPLGCSETVHDPDGVLDIEVLNAQIERTATFLDADLRVRVEPTLDGGIDERIDQLRRQCTGWDENGQLADDLVVVMFSPTERENGIFFGDSSDEAPDVAWDEATDAMIPHLRTGDYTDAVDAALHTLREAPSTSSASSSNGSGSDSNGGLIVVVLIALAAFVVVSAVRRMRSGSGFFESLGDEYADDGDDGQGWLSNSSSRRRRSSFGFGGSRRSGGSSRSSSRSSGSRRSAGGGSKKW